MDSIVFSKFKTVPEMLIHLSATAKEVRLALNLSQKSLASRSGVSLGTLKKFETTGKISIESLMKLSIVLDFYQNFDSLCSVTEKYIPKSIDEIIKDNNKKPRQRGRN